MGYRVDNITEETKAVAERLKKITCAANGWTREYFDENFCPTGDPKVAEEYTRVMIAYAPAIIAEQTKKGTA
jgi:hypothetical protein